MRRSASPPSSFKWAPASPWPTNCSAGRAAGLILITVSTLIAVKLILLAATAGFALDARLRLIPNLHAGNLVALAWHIIPVTLIAILFVVVGVSFRTGWFS